MAALAAAGHGVSGGPFDHTGDSLAFQSRHRTPSVVFDDQPRMFPGVVTRRRASSVARSGSISLQDNASESGRFKNLGAERK